MSLGSREFLRRFPVGTKSDFYLRHVCLSIRPPLRPSAWNKSAHIGRIFLKFISQDFFFENLWRKLRVSLQSDKNKWYFTWISLYVYDIPLNSPQGEMFQTEVVDKIKTHILILFQ